MSLKSNIPSSRLFEQILYCAIRKDLLVNPATVGISTLFYLSERPKKHWLCVRKSSNHACTLAFPRAVSGLRENGHFPSKFLGGDASNALLARRFSTIDCTKAFLFLQTEIGCGVCRVAVCFFSLCAIPADGGVRKLAINRCNYSRPIRVSRSIAIINRENRNEPVTHR